MRARQAASDCTVQSTHGELRIGGAWSVAGSGQVMAKRTPHRKTGIRKHKVADGIYLLRFETQ